MAKAKRGTRSKAAKAAKKARRAASPAQLAARARFAAMARARAGKSKPAKKAHKARKSHRARTHKQLTKHVAASAPTRVIVHKVPVGQVRKARARKLRGSKGRSVSVNPGQSTIGFLGGIRNAVGNVRATAKEGVKGYLLLAAGAGGAVFAGSLLQRATDPILSKFAPALVSNPMAARLLSVANYYGAGFLLTLAVKNPRTKRGILAGATIAAAVELIKPGLVRGTLARLPVVGAVFGQTLSGLECDLGAYVDDTLHGLGNSGGGHHADRWSGNEPSDTNDDGVDDDTDGSVYGYEGVLAGPAADDLINLGAYEGVLAADGTPD